MKLGATKPSQSWQKIPELAWEFYYPRLNLGDTKPTSEEMKLLAAVGLSSVYWRQELCKGVHITNVYLPTETVGRPNEMFNKVYLINYIIHSDFPVSCFFFTKIHVCCTVGMIISTFYLIWILFLNPKYAPGHILIV